MKKVLYISDLHIPMKNKRSKNKVELAPIHAMNWILNTVNSNNIDVIIFGGDLYDRGSDIEYTEYSNKIETLLLEIYKSTEMMFMVMGNHELHFYQNNPTFKYIDIKDELVLKQFEYKNILKPTMKLINVVSKISIGLVDMYFHHFSNEKKYVIDNKELRDRFVIGFYHDDIITFESKETLHHHRSGKGIKYINNNLFENVNIAILGHIHKPMEVFNVDNEVNTTVITPGSMLRNASNETHTYVDLPLLEIDEDKFNLKFLRYELPEYKEDFNILKVEENKEKYETKKILNENKMIAKSRLSEEDILDIIKDVNLIKLYNSSDNIIKTESLLKWEEYKLEKEVLLNGKSY